MNHVEPCDNVSPFGCYLQLRKYKLDLNPVYKKVMQFLASRGRKLRIKVVRFGTALGPNIAQFWRPADPQDPISGLLAPSCLSSGLPQRGTGRNRPRHTRREAGV